VKISILNRTVYSAVWPITVCLTAAASQLKESIRSGLINHPAQRKNSIEESCAGVAFVLPAWLPPHDPRTQRACLPHRRDGLVV